MAKTASKLHVAMLPWSAFGHMIPFYQLSIALAKQGVRISYMSTPRNIDRLPEIPCELVPRMQYVSLPLAEVPGLPKGAEATVDMEFDEIPYLKVAYDLLHKPFKDFVSSHSPDWVISDFAAHWSPEITREHQVQLMFFSVYTASTLVFLGPPQYLTGEGREKARPTPESLTSPPVWAAIFPPSVAFRGYEAAKAYPGFYGNNTSGITDSERAARLIRRCQAVGVRSCSSLFHSGWGSVIETLQHGHNLILLPFIVDQGLNARVMVDKGLGIEVERREDGSYTRDDIAGALRRAMLGHEAEEIRTRARKAARVFGDQKLQEEHYVTFGHMIPFYQIPIAVVKQGFGLSYVLTPKNIE
ncbi:hypothetical protein Cgig2_026849 [Carnegiea gigantea]|uniref:UDP-rhamnose:rhamnosyltransferase 1 n=1 Tax=Carnegiea gigantea TaxID=171969 RepID=A0A9Q1KWA5_9CARY|nr:hypothetical protein Cgig2_026849 [Carnegiea gigantea]